MLKPHLVLAVPLICMLMQAKAKIMVVRDVEREDVEFISKTLGCLPIAHIDHMRPEKLGSAELVEEVDVSVWVERGAGGGGVFVGVGRGGGGALWVTRRCIQPTQQGSPRMYRHDAGCYARIDHMRPEKLGSAELVEEVDVTVGRGAGMCEWAVYQLRACMGNYQIA